MTRREAIIGALGGAALAAVRGETAATDAKFEYAVLNLNSGNWLELHWANPKLGALPGSLLKIVPAMAHGLRHGGRFPEHECLGLKSGCWSPAAHGRVGIARAVAHSCNAYFLRLAQGLTYEDVCLAASALGVRGPASDDVEEWIGRKAGWRVHPLGLVGAYARVVERQHEAAYSGIMEGLRECAKTGTGRALGGIALAKTGTAGCEHSPRSPGDGWTVALWPPESPKFGAVGRACGEPGSHVAGRLKSIIQMNA